MKILYISQTFFADCDFPLVRELQRMGHDVQYYLPITPYNKRSTLIDIKKIDSRTGVLPATIYPELDVFKNEIDLNKLFIINQPHRQKFHPLNILLNIKLAISFIFQKVDVIHFVSQPTMAMKLIYFAKKNLVLTVHDPFTHSGRENNRTENDRILAFKKIKKLILLNERQSHEFKNFYKIPENHIFYSKLGMYDSICRVPALKTNFKKPFILFFGLVAAYKGIEYLMEAMKTVHKCHPNIDLVIAGGGKFYFDIQPYRDLDYIHIINRYIPTIELAGLLKETIFAVCPYKEATQSGVVQTAFSLNVPMIVTNVGALSESVIHGKYGLVIPPCDTNALISAINDLIENKEYLSLMRNNISTEWKSNMTWKSIATQYLDCYRAQE